MCVFGEFVPNDWRLYNNVFIENVEYVEYGILYNVMNNDLTKENYKTKTD